MPESGEVRRELLAQCSFACSRRRGDNEQNSPPIRQRPRMAGCRRGGAGRGG